MLHEQDTFLLCCTTNIWGLPVTTEKSELFGKEGVIKYAVEKSSIIEDFLKNNIGELVSISDRVVRVVFSAKLLFGQRPERN